MGNRELQRFREICLSFPEAVEKETWGHPTFRVRNKMFASCGTGEDEALSATMKAAPGEQEILLAVGHPFFRPAYVGHSGWIGIVLDATTDWEEIRELVTESYAEIAPKTLARLVLPAETGDPG